MKLLKFDGHRCCIPLYCAHEIGTMRQVVVGHLITLLIVTPLTFVGCNSRFTHANRHCPDHPLVALRREKLEALSDQLDNEVNNREATSPPHRYRDNLTNSKGDSPSDKH